jgi:NitT/TauT family transport system substrate-binding protein
VPLRIGVLPITDTVPLYVAQELGYFAAEGLTVELVPAASAAERDQMIATGAIDGQVSDLVATALFNADEIRLVIVRKARQATADSPQFRVLAAKDSPIQSVEDLRGVEIAVSQNSVIQYVTERLLQLEGLDPADVRTVNVPKIAVRLQLLEQGQVQAATLPDPLASLAILQGARVIVADSSHPEISQSVIAFREPVLRERREDVRRFMAAYERALADIESTPERFQDLLVEKGRVPEALKDNYTFPDLPGPEVTSAEEWQDVVQWALDKGLLERPVPYEGVVDDSFVR